MADKGRAWRCGVCGYIHYGDEPPDECPVCGASAADFEEIEARKDAAPPQSSAASMKIVIAGGGIAGLSAAEGARETAPDAEIILLSAEAELPYYRLNLTRYLAGEIAGSELPVHPAAWYTENRIELRSGKSLKKLAADGKRIELNDGSSIGFDKLVIASGAKPFVPPIPGTDLPHVHTLRTTGDANAILASIKSGMQVICIGGGILGIETAGALARRGATVTILEGSDHLMPRQLNAAGSDVLTRHLQSLGVDVMTQAQTARILPTTVELTEGSTRPADRVILAAGVRSDIGPFVEAGLSSGRGLQVDDFLRTSHPDILAAGDACEHDGVMYGSWAAAQYQGKIAGMNAAGSSTAFGGIPRSHSLKILGKDMFSIGEIAPTAEHFTCFDKLDGENYRLFMLRDNILTGALLLGDLALMADCRKAIETRTPLGAISREDEIIEAFRLN